MHRMDDKQAGHFQEQDPTSWNQIRDITGFDFAELDYGNW